MTTRLSIDDPPDQDQGVVYRSAEGYGNHRYPIGKPTSICDRATDETLKFGTGIQLVMPPKHGGNQ